MFRKEVKQNLPLSAAEPVCTPQMRNNSVMIPAIVESNANKSLKDKLVHLCLLLYVYNRKPRQVDQNNRKEDR